jgi:Resolvase, N terminal domain
MTKSKTKRTTAAQYQATIDALGLSQSRRGALPKNRRTHVAPLCRGRRNPVCRGIVAQSHGRPKDQAGRCGARRMIVYYRVSKQRQGRSGLGLEAQRGAVTRFAESEGLAVVAEFIEVETGSGADALAQPAVGRRAGAS